MLPLEAEVASPAPHTVRYVRKATGVTFAYWQMAQREDP